MDDSMDLDELEELSSLPTTQPIFNETYVETLQTPARGNRETGENDIKVLIATDIHVGYAETKPVIRNDSVNTFEEVLQIAVNENVDMILLGGDLFHENNPSRDMMCRVVRLLRKYCLNDKEVLLEFVSDPSINFFHSNFARVNYEDSNLNIGLPIFTIHGNHDDMAAKGLTALDELHESGLINLFGKYDECEDIDVSPILLRKGTTRLALYGIGSQRDDRLNRAFESFASLNSLSSLFTACGIKFMRPRAEAEGWFNMLAIHQNRPPRSHSRTTGNYLPTKYLPSFFDIVLWGHEHECKIQPEYVDVSADIDGNGFFIIQPGSTVATSLTEEEARQKHVSVITIRGRKFQSRPIPLQTTRQIFVHRFDLDTLPPGYKLPPYGSRPDLSDEIYEKLMDEILVREKIRELIAKAKAQRGPRQPLLPLIRINLVYKGPWAHMTPINGRHLSIEFEHDVANPDTLLVCKKDRRDAKKKGTREPIDFDIDITEETIEDIVSEYFRRVPFERKLTVMTDDTLKAAIRTYTTEQTSAANANRKLEFALDERASADDIINRLVKIQMDKMTEDTKFDSSMEEAVEEDLMSMKRLFYSETLHPPSTADQSST